MKYIYFTLVVALFVSSTAIARTAKVSVIDVDGETKSYTFFENTTGRKAADNKEPKTLNDLLNQLIDKPLNTKIKNWLCGVDFPDGKPYIELACMPFTNIAGKSFSRIFVRPSCSPGAAEKVLILNHSTSPEDEIEGISISANCLP